MSKILVAITMTLYMFFTLLPIVWSQSNEDARRPLDLPSGGSGDDEDDEDAPETINFWGGAYEGDALSRVQWAGTVRYSN